MLPRFLFLRYLVGRSTCAAAKKQNIPGTLLAKQFRIQRFFTGTNEHRPSIPNVCIYHNSSNIPQACFRRTIHLPATKATLRQLLQHIVPVLLWTPLLIFLSDHVFSISYVTNLSMSPTLSPDYRATGHSDFVLVYKWKIRSEDSNDNLLFIFIDYLFPGLIKKRKRLSRGSIIVFKSPQKPLVLVVKRIIGLPGDIVQPRLIRIQKELENGKRVIERVMPPPVQVPQGHLWVEGDEGFHSSDSNDYGPVSKGLVVGKVTHILWPLNRIRAVGEDWDDVDGRKGREGGRKDAVLVRAEEQQGVKLLV